MLNTAERHVSVRPDRYPVNGISYLGFHVDDHPSQDISRHFGRTNNYIDQALNSGGKVIGVLYVRLMLLALRLKLILMSKLMGFSDMADFEADSEASNAIVVDAVVD